VSQGALNPRQFYYQFKQAAPKEMEGSPLHELHAYGGTSNWHGSVGRMSWHHKTGEILNIEAYEPWRRQGVATHLLGEARRIAGETRGVKPPRHSADRTEAGDAWARSLGDRLPKRKQPTVAETESHFRDMGVEIQ
jgi:GNAT superfamily N-acetyltransferase